MPAEKKRPRGLKNSAANKKAKVAKEPVQGEEPEVPENAQTIVIDKVVEEGDEIGEAAALYESGIEKLETDTSAALSLLRGAVHESDRILRNWSSKDPLPALFYYTYGSSLYELGRLSEEEDFESYLDAAEERLNDALEHVKEGDDELKNKLDVKLAMIWFAKAASTISEGGETIPELATRALETLKKATSDSKASPTTIVELADIVQNHGDLYSNMESREKFTTWADNALVEVLKTEPKNTNAMIGLGSSKLSLANFWLDQIQEEEEEEEEEERKELKDEEKKALEAILESRKHYEEAKEELAKHNMVTPQILSELAEVYLNHANLVLEEEEQNKIYQEAAKTIKDAQVLIEENKLDYTLPEGLTSFLSEFE
ncbi:hypothetical protein K501DRAFT_338665 [Backusella circina FSU 941]|nr:hypothetical protein K501DRAFT_338665 [Backusella circina FSU 941]